MAKARPKTADELRAFIDQSLQSMSQDEQGAFWRAITTHPKNESFATFMRMYKKVTKTLYGTGQSMSAELSKEIEDLAAQLRKHRKPSTKTERDAKIIKLCDSGKTLGEILRMILAEYPTTTYPAVHSVVHRHKSKTRS